MNPYIDANFFEWFFLFFSRLLQHSFFLFDTSQMVSDDVQGVGFALFAVNAALLGSLLLLKRLMMIANAISHTMVLGVVLAFYVQGELFLGEHPHPSEYLLLLSAVSVALITAWMTQLLSQLRLIREEAANAMVFSGLFALGIAIVSTFAKNAHIGIELLMGNPDSMTTQDVAQMGLITLVSLFLIGSSFRGLFVALFDPLYATVGALFPRSMMALLLVLVSVTLVTSFRVVGCIMSLAFFVTPPLIAKLSARSFPSMVGRAVFISLCSALISVALSRHILTTYDLALSTGALAVTVLAFIYGLCLFFQKLSRRVERKPCGETASLLPSSL